MRSCRWTMPTTLRPPSSTGSAMIPCFSIIWTAAPARSSGVALFGVRVITSPTGMSRNRSVFSMRRVRSPAVTTPTRLPAPSTTATVPRLSARSTTHSRIGRSGPRVGRSRVSITSATRSRRFRPNAPPGCSAAKSSRLKPFTSSTVTASASPSASAAVVLAVGASVSAQASSVTLASSTTSAWRASTESGSPVIAISGTPSRLRWPSRPNSSSDAPLFESRIATSLRPTIPRSPCSESTGCRKDAGVPVEVNVAAILRPMRPDFPTPETISRPDAPASRRTAAANGGPRRSATRRIASASRPSTRRPRSTRSVRSVRDIATLLEVLRHQALPLAAGPEDQLGDLADGAVAPGRRRHDACGRLHFRHGIRHRDRQAHPFEQRKIGEVVAHERALLPTDAVTLENGREGRQLFFVLHDLVHLELASPQVGGIGPPGTDQHHGESRLTQELDAQAVLDVEALELHGVVADQAEVEAVVGEHAVDVEADELEAAGELGVEHRAYSPRAGGIAPAPSSTSARPHPWDVACAVPPALRRASTVRPSDCPTVRRLRTHCLPRPLPHVERHADDRAQLVERDHVGPVGRRTVGIGVRLEEEPVGTGGRGRVQQRRDELPQASARAVRTVA